MKRHYMRWAAVAMLTMNWSPGLSADEDTSARSIYEDDVYRRTFDGFYSRMETLPGDVLVDEMEEQIESVLMRGRHIAPADLQPKIRQVGLEVHDRLKRKLCPVETVGWSPANIEFVGVNSVHATLSADYKVQNGDYARIVSVLVRTMEGTKARFCNSTDFRDLAP